MFKKKGVTPLETTGQSRKKFLTGFTLVELMVVIAIIAVLAAVVTPQVFKQIEKGRAVAVINFYQTVSTATASFFSDQGTYPVSCGLPWWGVDCNVRVPGFVNPTGAPATWDGPYLERWPASAPFANSVYQFFDWAGGTAFGPAMPAGGSERILMIMNTPQNVLRSIDRSIDGGDGLGAGKVRDTWGGVILVSRDGPIS